MKIARPSRTAERVFPPIEEKLFLDGPPAPEGSPDERAARKLLGSAAKPGAWERLTRARRNSHRRCATLLWVFAEAVRAELANCWRRADFFFDEAAADFERLNRENDAWDTIAREIEEPDAQITKDSKLLRKRLVGEHLIDTHIALFNGYAAGHETLAPGDRSLTHITRLQALLPSSSLSLVEHHALLQQPLERLVSAHEKAKQWDAAIQTAETLVALAPDDVRHENRLVDLTLSRALADVSASDDAAVNREQARLLKDQIREMEALRTRFADNGDVYEGLAALHHLRGVKLANAGDLPDALLEVQKALFLQPSYPAAIETKKQLVEAMENLQKQVAAVEARMRAQPNLGLNEKGQELRRMAATGLKDVIAYAKSDAATELAAAATRARNRSLWRSIGLAEPPTDWDKRAAGLLAGMNKVAARQPADQKAIAAEWQKVRAGDPKLVHVDSEAICRFLAGRLLDEKAPSREIQPPATDMEADGPILRGQKGEPHGGGAPFSYWLTSPVDMGLKAAWAGTVGLALTAATLHVRETKELQRRAEAYAALSDSVAKEDHRAALEAAEGFFAARPSAKDGRESEVSALAEESLVRWIAQQSGELTAADTRLIDRFRQLIPKPTSSNNP